MIRFTKSCIAHFVLIISLSGCGIQYGKSEKVSPDSELGKQMLALDAVGRATQNKPLFSQALQEFESLHGGTCIDVSFDKLQEPGEIVSKFVQRYTIDGNSQKCGRRSYRAEVTFKDEAHTIAKRVEVIEVSK